MNTTKTLEAVKLEGKELFIGVWVPQSSDMGKIVDLFAEKVWEAALDACREKVDSLDVDSYAEREYMCISKEEALSAIDSLRTGGGKE